MTVVLVPIVAAHGPSGVFMVGLLAGLMLIALAFARAGRYMRYVPAPVVEGFTVGIAVVIALQQVPSALGVEPAHEEKVLAVAAEAVRDFAGHPRWPALLIAAGVATTMLVGARWRPSVPFSLVAVVVATVVVAVFDVPTMTIGALPSTLPAPSLDFLDVTAVGTCFPRRLPSRRWRRWSRCCRRRSPTR